MVERIRTLLESRELTPTQFADTIGVARPIVSHILSGRNKPSLDVVQRILAAMPDLAMPWLLNGTGPMLNSPAPSIDSDNELIEASKTRVAPVTTTIEAPKGPATYERIQAPVLEVERQLVTSPAVGKVLAQVSPAKAVTSNASSVAQAAVPVRFQVPFFQSNGKPKRFTNSTTQSETSHVPESRPTPEAFAPPLAPELVASSNVGLSQLPPESGAAPTPALPPAVPADSQASNDALASALLAGGPKPIRRIVIFYRDGSFADYQPE